MRVNSHHLKNRLLGLCPEIRLFNQGRDCYIAFDEDIGDILKDAKERNYDDHAVVLAKAADIFRCEFRTEVSWSLDQIDCQEECIPKALLRFIQMVLRGTSIQTDANNSSTKQADLTISQLIMYNSYIHQRKDRKSITAYHSKVREMSIAVYLGLLLHSQTRQKNLIDKLYSLGLSISYERVLEIETATKDTEQLTPEDYFANTEIVESEYSWLQHSKSVLDNANIEDVTAASNASWAAFFASQEPNTSICPSIRTMLPLFAEDSKSVAVIMHAMC